MNHVRNYNSTDYDHVIALYKDGKTFGGQFDEARDSKEKLDEVTNKDPQSILVYEKDSEIQGTVSLIENGRVAWLFRFAVQDIAQKETIAQSLYQAATEILHGRGHTQVLVYSDPDNEDLNQRYSHTLGMTKGGVFRCFWQEIG